MTYFVRNEEFAFGLDLSRYNVSADLSQLPDFDLIAAHEPNVSFVALRTGQSWGYKDPTFNHYYREAKRFALSCDVSRRTSLKANG